jgi:hypothetical protein
MSLLAHRYSSQTTPPLHLLTAGLGTKRARADAMDVRSWWKLTYGRSGGIRVLTHSCQSTADFAVMHNGPHDVVAYGRRPRGGFSETALRYEP